MARGEADVPKVLDRYHLVSRIGKGGMAEVFHARLQGPGGFERDVAVKVLLPEFSSEPDFVTMLLDEARIAGAIAHPCVVGMLDVGRQGDLFYLVMEYVDGCDLRSILRAAHKGQLKLTTALYLVGEVLRGLSAVHTSVDRQGQPRKIVHRDVSPANVLIDRTGLVKLGDFGIAHASSRITRTRNGAVKGKLRYMAPEQLSGLPVDHRADLYAVGIMLCEMLLGIDACEPRRMTNFGAVFSWSRQMAPNIPADVADILDRALTENSGKRYADAGRFRKEVVAALHRRAPGYAAEDLARDLNEVAQRSRQRMQLSERTEVGADLDPFEPDALFAEEQKPTQPFRPADLSEDGSTLPPLPAPGPTAPFVRVSMPYQTGGEDPEMLPFNTSPSLMSSLSGFANLKSISRATWRKVGLVAAGAASAALSVTLAVVLGSASSAAPLPAPLAASAPLVQPLPSVRPATGTLSVQGPAGTTVTIGSTSYPPAPCQLELPAGHYQVKLRKRAGRSHPVTRYVTIQPGREIALRL
ncbi:MAG TPA: serine/threonine-protein kinase [Kofleriaceae bacterium]|nr:serine/threonine-protein kinase [Kofleriaceae bacterium]